MLKTGSLTLEIFNETGSKALLLWLLSKMQEKPFLRRILSIGIMLYLYKGVV